MQKDEILKELEKHDNTVLSFPDRGPWGNDKYRGNCSGWIIASLVDRYNVKSLAEVFAGSGTGYDVAKDMKIKYTGIDLNPNPTREGIIPMDILDESITLPDGFYSADLCFMHPPYPGINNIRYSNVMWKDKEDRLASRDIQNMDFAKGMKAVNRSIARAYSAIPKGAFQAILVGDIRKNGKFYSMGSNLVLPGEQIQILIKIQHNTVSGRNGISYGNKHRNFYLTAHEFIYIVKKPSGYEICFLLPQKHMTDIRDTNATWKDVVAAALKKLGGSASLSDIYSELRGHKKAESNHYPEAKIRQTLQAYNIFTPLGDGKWSLLTA